MTEETKNTTTTGGSDLLNELTSQNSSTPIPKDDVNKQSSSSEVKISTPESGKILQSETKKLSLDNDLEELIASSSTPTTDGKKVEFGTSADFAKKEADKQKILKEKKLPQVITNYIIGILFLLAVLILGAIFFFFLRSKEGNTIPQFLQGYMPKVEKTYFSARKLLGYSVPEAYSENVLIPKGTGSNANAVADIIEDKKLDYISQKEILTKGVKYLYKETSNKYDQYETLKKNVSQQGFFPSDLQDISEGVFFNNSLQKAIISIESVRFATALNFFSALDSFMTQLSAYTSVSKSELEKTLDVFMERGEKDINNYIVSCYLNGYEASQTCNSVGDFDKYYAMYPTTGFNQRVFLATMMLIQNKLENTDFPSLDVSMKSINPLQNTINLNIEINTFKDDEMQLIQSKGILNPHIYLVTSIINNLRESRYVITDTININTLKVNKKKIKVGGETFVVNSSSFDFQLPLQANVQREIYDFTDITQRNITEFMNPLQNLLPQNSLTGNMDMIGTGDILTGSLSSGTVENQSN